ncbi:tyrosine--trna ligase [Quercus suber]|uniref:Tyrosine--trna ligase n=1 Tax=Quercus suber TaxID=58331 RepID=A0AAW0M764_QUESU
MRSAHIKAIVSSQNTNIKKRYILHQPPRAIVAIRIKSKHLLLLPLLHTFRSPPCLNNNNNVIEIFQQCGLIKSLTSPDLHDIAATVSSSSSSSALKVYCGFDPTAQSLHLGNLLGLIVLSWVHRFGHQLVALIVGNPSNKSLERPDLDLNSL